MRVNSIGPLGAAQTNEPDKDIEVESSGLRPELNSEIKQPDPDSPLEGDHQESREGLIRLVDYLQKQREEKRKSRKNISSKKDLALSRYNQLEDTEDRLSLRGKNFNRRA